jgi:hypothetical protein
MHYLRIFRHAKLLLIIQTCKLGDVKSESGYKNLSRDGIRRDSTTSFPYHFYSMRFDFNPEKIVQLRDIPEFQFYTVRFQ